MYYQKHIFCCLNQRDNGRKCCQDANANALRDYFKKRLTDLGLHGAGKFRVNTAGCLGRCAQGPSIVIYPEGVWYTYASESDIDKIIEKHLLNNEIVTELLMGNNEHE